MKSRMRGVVNVGGRTLATTVIMGALLAAIAVPAAMAEPKGEFKVFKECPISNEEVKGCLVSKAESGEVKIKSTAVPIVTTQTLQGGLGRANETTGQEPFFAASNGETLSKTPQKVPGGLLDFVKCNEIKGEGLIEKGLRFSCELIFENGTTGVNAVLELAKPASSIYINEDLLLSELPYPPYPPALVLPSKIKLENSLLGSECYIGSSSEPIELALTTGATTPPAPNKSIKGKVGEIGSKAEGEILTIKHNTLVGNAFSVPKASGCGLFGLLDGIVDSKLGLPSAAGNNTAILNNTVEQAGHYAVEESE